MSGMSDKRQEIKSRLKAIEGLLEDLRSMSEGSDECFYFGGPAYGMGGYLENGEWSASSAGSC